MARNDIVLIDSLLIKEKGQLGASKDDAELFELFCFDQVLKDFDLSLEELEGGWTDGPDDGGIDGLFVFADGHLVVDDDFRLASRQNPTVEISIFTVKRSDSFKQEPLNAINNSIVELLDFTITDEELSYPFRTEILEQRALLRSTIVTLADRRPKLIFRIYFCTRGDTQNLSDNLTKRADLSKKILLDLFGNAQATFYFIGASELLALARRQPSYSLKLKFTESYISREGGNYIVLAPLSSYYQFITDDEGKLRRYLFESNIRDYLGSVQVNNDIRNTLDNARSAASEDFWWFNNGITILATHANVVGKDIFVENVQIVNGLQTTETIYEYFRAKPCAEDDRAVLIKILLSADEVTRARIIKATNYQNTVDLSSLRGLDEIQRDIEQFLLDHNWYYDRRKNYYRNQGRPANRIVSIPYLASAVRAIALGEPARSQRQRAKSLRDDKIYNQVFNKKWDINVYLACLELTTAVEMVIQRKRKLIHTPPMALVHYIAYIYVCDCLGKSKYEPNEVARLADSPPSIDTINKIRKDLELSSEAYPGLSLAYEGIAMGQDFIEYFVAARYPLGVSGTPASLKTSNAHVDPTIVDCEQRRVGANSHDQLDTKEEAARLYRAAEMADSSLEIVDYAHKALKRAVALYRPNEGARVSFKRTIVAAALEHGIPKEKVEKTLRGIFITIGSIRTYGKAPTEREAFGFLKATARLLYYMGVDVKSI